MQRPTPRLIRRVIAAAALFAFTLPLHALRADAGCEGTACGAESAKCPGESAQHTAPSAAGGMRVSIDPKTGAYTDTPATAPVAGAHVTAPAEAPKETPLPGGGSLLDTRNFRHEITATASSDGLPKTNCAQTLKPAAPVE